MPKSHTLDPADIATENAVQQWLERCSYHLCDEDAQSRLAALANRVQGELSDKGIFVHSPIPEKIGAVDSAAWTAFEADLKRGYLQRTPEMEVLLKTLDEVHPIGKERLRTTTLTSLRQAMEGDPANPREITEAQLTKKFETTLSRLLNLALADTDGDAGSGQQPGQPAGDPAAAPQGMATQGTPTQAMGSGTLPTDGSVKLTLISYTGGWDEGLFNYQGSPLANLDSFSLGGNEWQIRYDDTSGGSNFSSDQSGATGFVTITAVPEPGGVALVMAAFAVAAAVSRRTR
jgi:hypothetical protein